MKPELFLWIFSFAKPGFKELVGGLPVLPIERSLVNGAIFGAEVVDVERLEDKADSLAF